MDFPGHFRHIFQQLNHQRVHGQLCDCVIVVGPQRFRAHRSILAACSTHFRALLSTAEGDEGGGAAGGGGVVELDPEVVTPEAFSALLDMIYTSTLTLGSSNVMDVLLAASHLHLNSAVKACKHHLSTRDVPTSPPSGWRSPAQRRSSPPGDQWSPARSQTEPDTRQQMSAVLQQLVLSLAPSAPEGGLDTGDAEEEAGLAGSGDGAVEGTGGRGMEQRAALPTAGHLHKRKSSSPQAFQGEEPGSRLRDSRRQSEENYGVGALGVARGTGAGELPSLDCLKTDEDVFLGTGAAEDEEAEEKYETSGGGPAAQEGAQLPTRSGGGGVPDDGGDDCHTGGPRTDGGTMVKVKAGEEEEEKMEVVEVKDEHLGSSYPDTPGVPSNPPSPLEDNGDPRDYVPPSDDVTLRLSEPQPCSNPRTEKADGNEDLGSQRDLGFSCSLNLSTQSVGGAEEEERLPTMTGAQTEDRMGAGGLLSQDTDTTTSASSSLVFPVASVPLQQLLAAEAHSFSDTFILQPSQSSQGGFLRGVRPAVGPSSPGSFSLCPSLPHSVRVRTTRRGREGSLGGPCFRRIAPKVDPISEASSSSKPPEAAAPALTRASEDVLSKCKKALMDHNVLVVEGARKYACRMCSKTFLNLTDCKKHIRVHTGEKPYGCLKCGKRFSQSSHLYKHYKTTCLGRAGPCGNSPSSQAPV